MINQKKNKPDFFIVCRKKLVQNLKDFSSGGLFLSVGDNYHNIYFHFKILYFHEEL